MLARQVAAIGFGVTRPDRSLRALAFALALTPLLAGPASAAIEVLAARITEGDLWVMGRSENAGSSVTLDDSFTEQTDARGHFEFRLPYHPASCVVALKTRTETRMAVVGNCGQRGPQGEAGPAGPPGPSPSPPAVSPTSPELSSGAAASAAPELPASGEAPQSCGARAAQYAAESGSKVWVVRRGRMSQQNPLRPAPGQPTAIILQVTIEGRTASAYGVNFDSMLQSGPPDQLEQESGNPIEWQRSIDPLPETIQIVASGARSVFARLKFQQCGSPPRVAPANGAASRPRADAANPSETIPRGLSVPKSVIDELPVPR